MTLRDYQASAVEEIVQAIMKTGSTVYVLPTGGGKTVVAAELARRGHKAGSRTLLLVHRRELVKQALKTLEEACPDISVGVEAAGWPSMPWAPLQVGMVQSISRREHDVNPDIVIVDEAHHARAKTWENVLNRWPKAVRVGLTATPERLDKRGLGEHFATMVLGPSIPDLVESGDLAPCRTLTVPVGLSLTGVKRDRHGEYQKKDLTDRVTGTVVAKAADAYQTYAPGKRAIFFGINREHSRRVCGELQSRGFRAMHVDGDDSMEKRDRAMAAFRTGGLDVVGNCDLISEGFDAPACEVVIMGSPTRSVTRFLQQAGRAMRPGPGKEALILDLAGIAHELGLPDEVRSWSLMDGEVAPPKEKKRTLRDCPECATAYYGPACPKCLYAPPLGDAMEAINEVETALQEARPRPKKKRVPRSEVWREMRGAKFAPDPEAALREIAQRRGYDPGWVRHVMNAWKAKASARA